MTFKAALSRGAALGALLAVAGVADAHAAGAAKAHRKPHHPATAAYGAATPAPAPPAATAEEVGALRAEIQELRAQMAAQAQAQAGVAAQVAEAREQAAAANASADSLAAQLETIPAQVNTAIGEMPKAKPSWAEKTQVGGVVFMDASGISQKSNGKSVTPSGSALDIKRAYLTFDHQFNDVYSANITTDFQYLRALNGVGTVTGAAPGVTTTSGATATNELYLKKVFLQAKYAPWFTVRLGATDLPWVPFVEGLYGKRYVENVLIDRTKFGTSTDWGVHLLGTFDPLGDPTGPVVSYQVSVIDGTGYKTPPGTNSAPRTDTVDVEGRISAKWYDFIVALGGYSGRLGNDAGFQFNAASAANTHHDATRFNALVMYANPTFRVGGEYFSASNWTAVNSVAEDKADGWSVFGTYQLDPQWDLFARYDYVKPNKDTAAARKDGYFNLGLTWSPVKIVDLSLVYKRDKVDNGTFSTSNGTIGGSSNGTYDEFGLFTQYRW